uniref:Mononegavirus-type SAM-dependent 2'-O-MTase domain-containing protein n=2 Tax=Anguilla anguilla TaxID=7936 RepID=A0A0E9S2Z4_ANGAN
MKFQSILCNSVRHSLFPQVLFIDLNTLNRPKTMALLWVQAAFTSC